MRAPDTAAGAWTFGVHDRPAHPADDAGGDPRRQARRQPDRRARSTPADAGGLRAHRRRAAGLVAIGADTAYLPIAPLFALAGCGQGLAIPATMAAALEIVPRQRSGIGSATVNAARQAGTVLGIAVLGTILADHIASTTPATLSEAFVNGLRPGLLTAGLIVLAGAALLVAMPATGRERRADGTNARALGCPTRSSGS